MGTTNLLRTWAPAFAACTVVGVAGCAPSNELGHLRAEPNMLITDVPRVHYDDHLQQACGASRVTAAGEGALARWPYLQKTTAKGVTLLWVGRGTTPGAIEITTPQGDPVATVDGRRDATARPPAGNQFVADIAGLTPASTYCYRLRGPDGTLWSEAAFATAPPADSVDPVRFSALGDLGNHSSDQLAVLEELEDVRSDFVLLTGDVAYDNGKRSELETNVFSVYREMMSALPFFPASGNHDYNTDDAKPFREAFALFENGGEGGLERWYSFDWGPVHVVVLDTEKIGDAQRAWLDADLSANELPHTVVVLHRPPFSSGTHGSDGRVRSTFVPVFEQHAVDLVLCGHDHDYERTESIEGVTYVVTGGGGRGTKPVGDSDFTAYSAQVAHFVYVTVEDDELRLVAIDATGQPFDEVWIPA